MHIKMKPWSGKVRLYFYRRPLVTVEEMNETLIQNRNINMQKKRARH